MQQATTETELQEWFRKHVSLDGKPYLLDKEQAKAVFDGHKNTLVTARAGSGKTRIIVAKIAYLVAQKKIQLDEIAAFMFNRAAAAEVNERISSVKVDGKTLPEISQKKNTVASTFHKFALDTMRMAGEEIEIVTDEAREKILDNSLQLAIRQTRAKINADEMPEIIHLVNNFITRAGQKFPGDAGLDELRTEINRIINECNEDKDGQFYRLVMGAYENYYHAMHGTKIDFNVLMERATKVLLQNYPDCVYSRHDIFLLEKIQRLKYFLVDEYQDFSDLFYNILEASRALAPNAKLFAVGDDWQAINRFAGSDVDYFTNFGDYFKEDMNKVMLATNYRSAQKIVEYANRYMLKFYNPGASRATAFSKKSGKIKHLCTNKTKFDVTDIEGDKLGDARYQLMLAKYTNMPAKKLVPAARILKQVIKVICKNRKRSIMILHRHNYLSVNGVTLDNFYDALKQAIISENIMAEANFDKQVRCMTMHKSKGLEADVVILLEMDRGQILSEHPHATMFPMFGDSRVTEKMDQHRLIYVALTRAKEKLFILRGDKKRVI